MTTTALYTIDPGLPSSAVLAEGLFEILNHCDLAKAKLIEQFKTRPRIESLLCDVFIQQIQELEVALFDLRTETTLDDAVGVQLDVLGVIIGQGRLGLGDENYRVLLKARVLANRSDGQLETLIAILVLIYGEPVTIVATTPDPASVRLEVLSPATFDEVVVQGILEDAKGGGVRLVYVFIEQAVSLTFSFADGAVAEIDPNQGFADSVAPGTGGRLAGVLAS